MSDLSFDINGDPLPNPESRKEKKQSATGVRIIRTPSPSNLATTIITHRRHSSSASSHSSDKSLHLVTGPTGTVVSDLQSDTLGIVDRASSYSPYRSTTATRTSSSAGSTSSKRSYRIIKDGKRSPSPSLQFDVTGNIVENSRRSRSRRADSVHKSTRLVADPTGTVVENLKADTTGFPDKGDHHERMPRRVPSRGSSASDSSYRIVKVSKDVALEDLHFHASGNVMNSDASHRHSKHHITRTRSPPSEDQKIATPLLPSSPSTPAALYASVFGDSTDPKNEGRRASSSSSASSISSGYVKAAGETRGARRRGRRAR